MYTLVNTVETMRQWESVFANAFDSDHQILVLYELFLFWDNVLAGPFSHIDDNLQTLKLDLLKQTARCCANNDYDQWMNFLN